MGTISFVDGFDDYAAALATGRGWSANFAASDPGRVAGFSARVWETTTAHALTSDARYTFACAAWMGNNTYVLLTLISMMEGATVHGSLKYNGDGTFSIVNSAGAAFATSGVLNIVPGVPFHIEFDYKVDDSTGAYELRVNGSTVIGPTSGVDTRNGATGTINGIRLLTSTGQRANFDDLVCTKGGGFIGDCRVVTQWPTGDGANTAWTDVAPPTIGYQANTTLGGTSWGDVVTWPTHQIGDVALLVVESAGGKAVTLSIPSGFIAVANSPQATGIGTAGTQVSVFWCRAYKDAMPSVTIADTGDHITYVILTVRGCVKSGSPFDVTAGSVKAVASTSATVSEVTTTVAGCLIVQALTSDLSSASAFASAQTNANLTGITERVDAGTTQGTGGQIAIITATKTAAGATGTTAWTVTSSINAFLTMALLPAGTDDYAAVAEEVANDDLDYIYSATATDRETFTFPAVGIVGTVKAVAINHVSRKDDTGTRLVAPSIRAGSTNYDGTGVALSTSYAAYQAIYEEDPSTTDPWDVADIDTAEFGVYLDT
jgi:hypothetical protein